MPTAPINDVATAELSALKERAQELAYLAQMCGQQQTPVPEAELSELRSIHAELTRRNARR